MTAMRTRNKKLPVP